MSTPPKSITVAAEIKRALEQAGHLRMAKGAEWGHIGDDSINTIAEIIRRHYGEGPVHKVAMMMGSPPSYGWGRP